MKKAIIGGCMVFMLMAAPASNAELRPNDLMPFVMPLVFKVDYIIREFNRSTEGKESSRPSYLSDHASQITRKKAKRKKKPRNRARNRSYFGYDY